MNRDDAKKLQQALNAAGHDAGLLDGIVGPQTCKASATYLLDEHKDSKVADVAWSHLKYADDDEMIDGIDVSNYQGNVNWYKVKESGLAAFCWVKISEGTTLKQSKAARNLGSARGNDIPVGGYHFGRADTYEKLKKVDAINEARNFIAHYGTIKETDLRPVLDVESGFLKNKDNWNCEWILEWSRVVEAEFGSPPILYCARWASQSRLLGCTDKGLLEEVGKMDLWWAEYRNEGLPRKNLAPWKEWKVHQWTGSGVVPGIRGKCDRNRMKKSMLKELTLS